MRITNKFIPKFFLYLILLFTSISEVFGQNKNDLDSIDYVYLDSSIAIKIKLALHSSKIDTVNQLILFSVRFNIDKSGTFFNIQGSSYAPKKVMDSLQVLLNKNINTKDQVWSKISDKGNLSKNFIIIPIYLLPMGDPLATGNTKNVINPDMIRDMFLFSRAKYRKSKTQVYYYWFSPFSGIVLSPLSHPYGAQR